METVVYSYNSLEVVRRKGRLFVRYDAGAHYEVWREDELTEEQFKRLATGPEGCQRVLIEIQNRLTARGVDPYQSNWPPAKPSQIDHRVSWGAVILGTLPLLAGGVSALSGKAGYRFGGQSGDAVRLGGALLAVLGVVILVQAFRQKKQTNR